MLESSAPKIQIGGKEFRRANIAVFSCGFSIFAILYCTQPVLPLLARAFAVTPAQSSLVLSVTTIVMAITMPLASSVSEVIGRKPLMVFALVGSSLLTLALAAAPTWTSLIWLRALAGLTLSGAPAVTLAYLAEEMERDAVAPAVGLYIGGGALGGMCGRLVASFLSDWGSWRWAMAGIAITGLVSAIIFWRALPASRHFEARRFDLPDLALSMARLLRRPIVLVLVAEGFILLGAFMTVYNYVGFRLQAPPFNLDQSLTGLVFLVYPVGSYASALAGRLAGRFGRSRVLCASIVVMIGGLAVMAPDHLFSLVSGLAAMTFGFFGAHSILSGWAPAMVDRDKAQASSLYLLFYYIGGGVAGSYGGVFWTSQGWTGVTLFAGVLMVASFVAALSLARMASSN